jgi:hypothetical protein
LKESLPVVNKARELFSNSVSIPATIGCSVLRSMDHAWHSQAEFHSFGKSGRRGPYVYSVLLYRYPEASFGYFASVVDTSEDSPEASKFWGQKEFATAEEAERTGVHAITNLLHARRLA